MVTLEELEKLGFAEGDDVGGEGDEGDDDSGDDDWEGATNDDDEW